jgi:hypothetical protein
MSEPTDHWIRTSDARIPRRRITRGEGLGEDIVDRALGGQRRPQIADVANAGIDADDDGNDPGTSVPILD